MDRRNFIQKSALTSAGLITAFHVPASGRQRKIRAGLIGCGWYGMVITSSALKTGDVEIAAICDVDSGHLNSSAGEFEKLQGSRPAVYKDYRELLDHKGLEVVFIATPPHWHALQFIAACEKGLDIYCEKPLAYDIREGEAMVKAARKAGNIVQIGFQRRHSRAFMKAKEMIAAGDVGKLHQVGAQIHYNPVLPDNTIQAPPPELDWDQWCGPAPKLDYRPSIGHKAWRLERSYGNGHFVDWGIHHIDIIRVILNLGMPQSFLASGGLNTLEGKITTPDTLRVVMNFDGCELVWQHRLWGTGDLNVQFNNGIFFYGEKATLFASDELLVKMPAGKGQVQETISLPTPAMQDNHVGGFIEAVKTKNRKLISCAPEDAFKSTATVQLGMISYYEGKSLIWDAASGQLTNQKEMESYLARPYRKGYDRPQS
jgi:predicted dehydrogenase